MTKAKYDKEELAKLKRFRSEISKLKKKGIISSDVDARSVLPTKYLKAKISRSRDILEGKATTYKVGKKVSRETLSDLRDQGYKVVGKGDDKRIVMPSTQKFIGGKVYTKSTTSRKESVLQWVKLKGNIESQIQGVFSGLKDGEFVGFQVDGYNSYDIFGTPESLLNILNSYFERDFKPKTLVVFRLTPAQQVGYIHDAQLRRLSKLKKKRLGTARERRSVKSGLRKSRGK